MSGYHVKRPEAQVGPGDSNFEAIAGEYPRIAWLLAGRPKDHPEGSMLPLSLILFLDGGKLKFCFSSKHSPDCMFGCCETPDAILGGVEAALAAERYEWKKSRR